METADVVTERQLAVFSLTNAMVDLSVEEKSMLRKHAAGDNLVGLSVIGEVTPIIRISYGTNRGHFVYSLDEARTWKAFKAVLICTRIRRAFWDTVYDVKNPTPPSCKADQGVVCTGGERPSTGVVCSRCPHSKWRPDPETGELNKLPPECSTFIDHIMFHEDHFIFQLTTSGTSLKHTKKFLSAFKNSNMPSYAVWSEIKANEISDRANSWYEVVMSPTKEVYGEWRELMTMAQKAVEDGMFVDEYTTAHVDEVERPGVNAALNGLNPDQTPLKDKIVQVNVTPQQGTLPTDTVIVKTVAAADDAPAKPKRKRRSKEEIQAEKAAKEAAVQTTIEEVVYPMPIPAATTTTTEVESEESIGAINVDPDSPF